MVWVYPATEYEYGYIYIYTQLLSMSMYIYIYIFTYIYIRIYIYICLHFFLDVPTVLYLQTAVQSTRYAPPWWRLLALHAKPEQTTMCNNLATYLQEPKCRGTPRNRKALKYTAGYLSVFARRPLRHDILEISMPHPIFLTFRRAKQNLSLSLYFLKVP